MLWFSQCAIGLLAVLRTFERAGHVGKQKFSTEWEEFILSDLKRQKLNTYYHLVRPVTGRSADATS